MPQYIFISYGKTLDNNDLNQVGVQRFGWDAQSHGLITAGLGHGYLRIFYYIGALQLERLIQN